MDFRARGVWVSMFEFGNGGNFLKRDRRGNAVSGWGRWGEDEFEAKTRIRLQLDAVAGENLSGSVYFEIGAFAWGRASRGGALGGDGTIVKVKHACTDWTVPGTNIRTRMGLQRVFLPDYASEASQILDGDVAAVTVNVPVNGNFGVTAFWARPFNDNRSGDTTEGEPANCLDNMDLFGLSLPIRFDGARVTPFAMVGVGGRNAFRGTGGYYHGGFGGGLSPAAYATGTEDPDPWGTGIWAGVTGELTAFDPFRAAFSFNYGSWSTGDAKLDKEGWYASLLAEYRLDFGVPGVYGWYASGDDGNIRNGSERLPSLDYNNESTSGFSGFGQLGTWTIGRDAVLGYTLAGTWGVGVRLKDVSFVEKLKHTFRVNLYKGTNDAAMARHIKSGAALVPSAAYNGYTPDFNSANPNGIYLTEKDCAMELGLMTTYQVYENLRVLVEANYIALWLDQSSDVWGGYTPVTGGSRVGANSVEDCWNVNVSFIYRF